MMNTDRGFEIATKTVGAWVSKGFSVRYALSAWAGGVCNPSCDLIDRVRVHYGLAPIGDKRPAPGRIP